MTAKSYLLLVLCVALVGVVSVPALAESRVAPPEGDPRDRAFETVDGGPSCATATTISMLPYVDSGNSCNGGNDLMDYNNFSMGGDCNSLLYPGPDVVYRIELFEGNQIDLTMTPTAPADLGLFLLSDCTVGTSCVDFEDQIGGGAPATLEFVQLPPGQYFIYVDSYYTSGSQSCGNYQLTVDGDVPAQLLDFSVE